MFELFFPFWLGLCVALGITVGGGLGEPVWGGAVGFVVGVAPMALLGFAVRLMEWWKPDRPPCPCGRCLSSGYDYMGTFKGDPDDYRTWEYASACPCGRCFVAHGGCYSELMPDGERKPYMVTSRRGRWQPHDMAVS